MADQLRNNYRCTISNSPGTSGAFTISGAVSAVDGVFVAGDDGLSFSVRASETGVGQEHRTGCVYTHSSTSLSRGTLEGGSALNFTSACVVEVIATAATGNRWDGGNLAWSAASVTTADVTGVVGTMHGLDLSGLTAARNFTLPAVAAVNDRIGIYVTAGCTTAGRELIVKANTGDTLNGVSAAEWSRMFNTDEVLIMRCTVANTAWVVDHKQFVPAITLIHGTGGTDQTGTTRNAYNKMSTVLSNVISDTSSCWSVANKRFDVRRSGNYFVRISNVVVNLQASQEIQVVAYKNGASASSGASIYFPNVAYHSQAMTGYVSATAGQYLEAYCYYGDASTNRDFYGSAASTQFTIEEVL